MILCISWNKYVYVQTQVNLLVHVVYVVHLFFWISIHVLTWLHVMTLNGKMRMHMVYPRNTRAIHFRTKGIMYAQQYRKP